MDNKIVRIYPESKTGLINWIEENFHDIDEFVVTFKMKNNTTMTVYDAYTYFNALGMSMINLDTIQKCQDEFKPKE